MYLVDKQIRELGNRVIVRGYDPERIGPVSYDVTINSILAPAGNKNFYSLPPGEAVFIQTEQEIHVPDNLLISIGNKNSLLRLGLTVDGPKYFPGHQTVLFLRVENISANVVELSKGMEIAQMFYEQLSEIPEAGYGQRQNVSFQNETEYREFGNYQKEYESRIQEIEKASQKLEDTETRIYGNILTLMGIFVAVFSLIFVNMDFAGSGAFTVGGLLVINVSLGLILTLFLGLILLFFNKIEIRKYKTILWILSVVFIGLLIILCLPGIRDFLF